MLWRFLLLFTAIGISTAVAAVDVEYEKIWREQPELMTKLFAEQFGLDPELDKLYLDKIRAKHFAWGMPPEPLPVLRHIKGENGIALPTKEELMKLFEFTPEKQEKIKALMLRDLDRMDRYLDEAPALGLCREAVIFEKKFRAPDLEALGMDNITTFDALFLAAGQMPPHPVEAFGVATATHEYSGEKRQAISVLVNSLGLKCLPTRIRATDRAIYWMEGEPAIRNFDQDANGPGYVDEQVQRLAEFLQRLSRGEE